MNVSGTLNFFRLIREPSLCLPHHTVPTFSHLPVPLSQAFTRKNGDEKVDIRAVVLDKDNCFAIPKQNEVHKPYSVGLIPSPRWQSQHNRAKRNASHTAGWSGLMFR